MMTPLAAPYPKSTAWLGYGGLLPFLMLPAVAWLDPHHELRWLDALRAYGAVILTFVGALHWAFAMTLPELPPSRRTALYIWSTLPALIAWPSLMLIPTAACPLLIIGFVLHLVQDRRLVHIADLPDWYLPLRLRLTTVACLALGVGFWLVHR